MLTQHTSHNEGTFSEYNAAITERTPI